MHTNTKIALHVLVYDVEDFLDPFFENVADFYGKIYVAYSSRPWAYGGGGGFNHSSLEHIKERYSDKVVIIEGVWDTEEDQRNACVEAATRDGFKFLVVQDADEFYNEDCILDMHHQMLENDSFDLYKTKMLTFWRNKRLVLAKRKKPVINNVLYAINLAREVRFVDKRATSGASEFRLDTLCYHLSYVMSNAGILRKICTWAHANDFNRDFWYKNKWETWYPNKRYLHPINPIMWEEALNYQGPLPLALEKFKNPTFETFSPSIIRRAYDQMVEVKDVVSSVLARMKRSIGKRLCVKK